MINSNNKFNEPQGSRSPQGYRQQIGSKDFIVQIAYSPTATEPVDDKIYRLLKLDVENSAMTA